MKPSWARLVFGCIVCCLLLPGHAHANSPSNQHSLAIYNDLRAWMQESLQNAVPLFCTLNRVHSGVAMRFYFPTQNMVGNVAVPAKFSNLGQRLMELQTSCQPDMPILLTSNRTLLSVARGSSESNLVAVLQGMQQNANSGSSNFVDTSIMAASQAVTTMQSAPAPGDAKSLIDDLLLATSISSVVVGGHPIVATKGVLAKVGTATTRLGLVLSFACVAGDSYSLYRSIQQGDRAGIASAGVSLAGSVSGTAMSVTSIVLAAKGAAVSSAVTGLVTIPVAGLTFGVSALVGHAIGINQQVEACLALFGDIIHSYETPILTLWAQGTIFLVGSNLTVFKHIDMRNNRIWFGEILVKKNSFRLNGPTVFNEKLNVVEGFGFAQYSSFVFDESRPTMILPLTGTIELDYDIHQTFKNWNLNKPWQLVRLNELYERMNKEFAFYGGFIAMRRIHILMRDTRIKITLPPHPRTFIMEAHRGASRTQYNLDYEFVGSGSLTIIKPNTRPNGRNNVILTGDVPKPSVWLFDATGHTHFDTSLSCNNVKCDFSLAGVSVTVVQPAWHVVLCMINEVVYMADFQRSTFVPFLALTAWVQRSLSAGGQAALEAKLRALPNVHLARNVRLQWLPMLASSTAVSSQNCPPSYVPNLQAIVCRSIAGVIFRSYNAQSTSGTHVTMAPYLYDLTAVQTQARIF